MAIYKRSNTPPNPLYTLRLSTHYLINLKTGTRMAMLDWANRAENLAMAPTVRPRLVLHAVHNRNRYHDLFLILRRTLIQRADSYSITVTPSAYMLLIAACTAGYNHFHVEDYLNTRQHLLDQLTLSAKLRLFIEHRNLNRVH